MRFSQRSSKALAGLVLACGLGLLLVLALRADSPPLASVTPPAPQEGSVQPAPEPQPLLDALAVPEPPGAVREPATDASAPQLEPSLEGSAPEPASITLYGFVLPAEGRELQGDVGVNAIDRLGGRQSVRTGPDGAYAISGLIPGPYWIFAGSTRMGQAKLRIDLDGSQTERRLDLELVLPPQLRVKVTDLEGQPLKFGPGLAVATLEPPGDWFHEVVGSFNNPFGVGHFWESGFASEQLPEEYIGTLILDVEPPVHVSLLNYQRVVATQRAEPGQREVEFVIDRDSPLIWPGEVRFHFVDAVTGGRLESSGASLHGHGSRTLTPVDGEFHARVSPGLYEVSARVEGYESGRRHRLVEPGRNDFGPIPLDRAVWIAGEVVDDLGNGIAGSLRLVPFDSDTGAPVRQLMHMSYRSDPDGSFRIDDLSRASYLLTFDASDSPWARTGKQIDTRAGPVENVRLELARGVPLLVRPSGDAVRDVRYQILDADGELVLSSRLWSEAPYPIPLAPGTYTVVARIGQGEPQRIPVTIAGEPVELALP